MDRNPTRPSLLHRVKDSGDTEAWRAFDERYGELIQRYCLRLGLQPADADEVRQTVLIDLAGFLPRFEYDASKGRFRSYLGRVVGRAAGRHRRRTARPERPLSTALGQRLAAPDDDRLQRIWQQEWMRHHYRIAFDTVRQHHSTRALQMSERLLSGASVGAVADEFGVADAAVYKLKQRVRDELAAHIATQVAAEDQARD